MGFTVDDHETLDFNFRRLNVIGYTLGRLELIEKNNYWKIISRKG
jgi:hypothetical protein